MKKYIRIIYTSIFTVCCACFLLACFDTFNLPTPQESPGGEGTFSLVIGSDTTERTILPATVQNNFLAYTLVFSSTGKDNVSVDRTNSTLVYPVTLTAATWNLTVTAYMDSGKTKPAAQGSLTGIVITTGGNVSRSLELKPIIENGAKGTFSWNIGYPTDVKVASIKITPLDASGTTEQTLYFIGGTPSVNKNNTSYPLSLNTGYYQVILSLSNGEHSTGREEYLHVYKNMDSRFEYTFTQDHFTVLSVTNGNDSGPGSLRHAITNAADNNTILIESGVGPILLTSRLLISKNLTIAGNGVTITRNPSWTTIDTSSQLLYISGTTVTISRVHFKDGRASSGSAVYIPSGSVNSVNLESCIFSGNQCNGSNTGGTIYNGGILNVKGSTFYGNSSSYSGGAIYNPGTLNLTGNLFYGNTASLGPAVRIPSGSSGNTISAGYNVVDVPLGTTSNQSGWTGHSTDRTISNMPIAPATFKVLSGREAQNVIISRPSGYPTVDFYGNSIPVSNVSAGAVQAVASGYLIELSVNNSALGSAAIMSAPTLNADGLYSNGSVTFTATSTGPTDYGFQYWLVNNLYYTTNILTLTLTNHLKVQAVFGWNTPNSVRRVLFSGQTETVTLNGLSNNEIYLVKVNTSENIVNAANTGGSSGSFPSLSPSLQRDWYTPEKELLRMGHPDADVFNANPPPIIDVGPRRSRTVFVPPVVGDTRMFWIESYYHSGTWVQKQATLRATGQYGNIWIMDENYGSGGGNKISTAQAQTLSAKFDLIYPAETNLIGFEYGGGPGGDGGKDGDPKIQILVYDIVDNSGVVQAAGFFWGKDFYEQSQLSTQKTNLAEIFYIDASQVITSPDYIYSTLVHEFQHMIHFNMKSVKNGKSSQSWYNEMLSMMTEDVMASHINGPIIPNSNNKVMQRVRTFLTNYEKEGITEWNTLDNNSYAKGMTFGAYLLRNYGGASLLKEMLANNSTNIESVTTALRIVNTNNVLSFEEALRRYGEAMVFSGTLPIDVQSFDKTVIKTIGSYTYTATKFNIWSDFGSTKPKIFGVNEQLEMRPYSLTVHQDSAATWKNQSGNVTITLQRPNDPNVEFYLMVK